jgi:ketosteroid isomerase-like protein
VLTGALAAAGARWTKFEDVRIDVFEHTALVTGLYLPEFEIGGQPNAVQFYLTFLLVNDAGQWKIVHEGLFNMPDE